jgi:hypothetical protein
LLLASAATLAAQPLPQFSGDTRVTSHKGMTIVGKLYFGSHKFRADGNYAGRDSIMIIDSDRKIGYRLMPQQHMYMEMSTEGAAASHKLPDWRLYDPSNPCSTMPGTSCQQLGTETVNGRLCVKWQITGKTASSNHIVWVDQEIGFGIKTQSTDGDVWEILNIKVGPQDSSLFEIPPGYRKMDFGNMMQMQGMPGMQRPQQ